MKLGTLFFAVLRSLFPRQRQRQPTRAAVPSFPPDLSLGMTPGENLELIKRALRDHDIINCELHGKHEILLPLALVSDRLTVRGEGRKRTFSVRSPRSVWIDKIECAPRALGELRLAAKQGITAEIAYFDEDGAEVTAEIRPPIEEQGEFFLAGNHRIRTKWIQSVSLSLDEIEEADARCLTEELLISCDPCLRQCAVSLSAQFFGDEFFNRLVRDPDPGVRGAIADVTRSFTQRTRKQTKGTTYTWIADDQSSALFSLLSDLAQDGCVSVRQKAAYALGDHRGEASLAILDRLSCDPAEEVRSAAIHAKERLREQANIRTQYELASTGRG